MRGYLYITILIAFSHIAHADDCSLADQLYAESLSQTEAQQLATLKSLVASCPDHALSLNHLGLLMEEVGNFSHAYDYYNQAIQADVNYPAPLAGKADVEFIQENYSEAIQSYEKFLALLVISINEGDPYELAQYEASYQDKLNQARQIASQEALSIDNSIEESGGFVSAETITRQLTVSHDKKRNIGLSDKPSVPLSIDIPIQFDYDSTRLNDSSIQQVKEISKALSSPTLITNRIMIEGHADADGDDDYNLQLSEKRALAVKALLVSAYGLSAQRFKVIGFGESVPIATNRTEEGRAKNRRVRLVNLGQF